MVTARARAAAQAAKTRARAHGRVAQSGLGRGLTAMAGQGKLSQGHGLLNWQCEHSDGSAVAVNGRLEQWRLRVTAKVAQEKTGEGEYEVIEWPAPSPLFISLRRKPKGLFPLIFAIIANLGLACITTCISKFLA